MDADKEEKKPVLVIATNNIHKIREIKAILHELIPQVDLLSLKDFPHYTPPQETGNSFEENSILKAVHAAKELNHYTLSDDSGLIVPALSGEPGIFSARYAGENSSDADNRKKLLDKLKSIKEKDRFAYFECCVCVAGPEGLLKSACASCEGIILQQERGGGGFGYDPIFLKHDYNKTFSELSENVKNQISHRRKALNKIIHFLESLFTE